MPNIKLFLSFKRIMAFTGLVTLFVYSMMVQSGAQPAFSQGFKTEGNLKTGMIVRLKKDESSTVQALNAKDIDKMYGIVVDHNDSPVTLSGDDSKVFVAIDGQYSVLVSDMGGNIKSGDFITISLLNGIGMKAGDTQPVVVGKAVGVFNDKSESIGQTSLKDAEGKETKTKLGRVKVAIDVGRNPHLKGEEPKVPDYLKRAAESIAGKEVAANRIYTGLVILFISAVISLSLLYGGVRSGIISIGRNPLSKKLILRGMVNVILTGITIFIIGVVAVYLLLKL